MSSYRRYTTHKDVAKRAMRRVLRHITHKDAAERAVRQVLRHRMETYAEPFPDGSMYVQPVGVEALVRGMESLRDSLENWPVPPPSFQSQTPLPAHDVMQCPTGDGHAVMMNGHCALCSQVDPAPEPKVVGYQRTGNSRILRCLDHPLPRGYEIPVTSEDLENGGICTWCGNNLLAHPGVNQ